jgi:hypothetical protein
MKDNSTETNVSRRKALQVIGVGVIAPSILSACQQQAEDPMAKKEAKKGGPATAKAEKKEAEQKKAEEKTAMAEGGEKEKAGGELNCNDPSYYDAQSAQMRKTLQYVEQSEKEGKYCNNCMQYLEKAKNGKGPDGCGGCKLFTGPVNPKGYCLSYAPKQA